MLRNGWVLVGVATLALGARLLSAAQDDGRMPPPVSRGRVAATGFERWIADLAHDDVRGNAQAALAELRRAGERARAALEDALRSPDHQQRQLAASLLRALGGEPSRELLLVSLEGLRHDRIPADPGVGLAFLHLPNARESASFLVGHARRVEDELLRGLQSVDGQERLLCAYVLAASRTQRGIERTTHVLIEHLADNDVPGDAVLASAALYRLGAAGLPFVRHAQAGADEQALALLRLVELDVLAPPRDAGELRARKELHAATRSIPDPALQCDVNTGGLVEWGERLSRDAGLAPR